MNPNTMTLDEVRDALALLKYDLDAAARRILAALSAERAAVDQLVEASRVLCVQIAAEGRHGYRVHELASKCMVEIDTALRARVAELEKETTYWKRMTERARCGCFSRDCRKHGSYVPEEVDRARAEPPTPFRVKVPTLSPSPQTGGAA